MVAGRAEEWIAGRQPKPGHVVDDRGLGVIEHRAGQGDAVADLLWEEWRSSGPAPTRGDPVGPRRHLDVGRFASAASRLIAYDAGRDRRNSNDRDVRLGETHEKKISAAPTRSELPSPAPAPVGNASARGKSVGARQIRCTTRTKPRGRRRG